ncbi:MAG: tetratricopeptide repeat protein, partial [bacterium]
MRFLPKRVLVVMLGIVTLWGSWTVRVRGEENEDRNLYQLYAERYFWNRNLALIQELLTRETFLNWLSHGVVEETKKRAVGDPHSVLALLNLPELGLGVEEVEDESILEDAPLRIKYMAYERSLNKEFHLKYHQIRTLKDRLIQTASPSELKRMFQRDLNDAFLSYRDGNYKMALLQFDECVERYGFQDIADVIFYRGETLWALQLYQNAASDYQYVVEKAYEPNLARAALEKLLAYYGSRGNKKELLSYWEKYRSLLGENPDEQYWKAAELVATMLMGMEKWDEAEEILSSILIGVKEKRMSYKDLPLVQLKLVDCDLARLNIESAEKRLDELFAAAKKGTLPKNILEMAQLRLGVIHYLTGDYDLAFVNFGYIQGKGLLKESADLLSLWSLYKMGAVRQAYQLGERFLEDYPQSQHQFEVKVIVGACKELLGEKETGEKEYREVIKAIDDYQEYHNFNYEIKSVIETLSELARIEEEVFIEGYDELFPEYLALKQKLTGLLRQIKLRRTAKSFPVINDIILEREAIVNILREQVDLEDRLNQVQDPKLYDEYDRIVSDLLDIESQLSKGVAYYLKKKSLLEREADAQFERLMVDSLHQWLDQEYEGVKRALEILYAMRKGFDQDRDGLAESAGLELDLLSSQAHILDLRSQLSRFGREEIVSNLNEWAEVALRRQSFGNLPFDSYWTIEERSQRLDAYLQSVTQVLESREQARMPKEEIPPELQIRWQEGQPVRYEAPMVPLWGMKTGESRLDTKQIEQPKMDETSPQRSPLLPPNDQIEGSSSQ